MPDERDGYTMDSFKQLLHERLAAAHFSGKDGECFPVGSQRLLEHYAEQLMREKWNEATRRAADICRAVNNYDNPMTAGDCADEIEGGLR